MNERSRVQLIVFTLDQVEFAVPIEQVWRVEPVADQRVTRVPRAPAFLDGVINVRGQVIPVLDLRKRFGFAAGERPPKARLLVIEIEGQRVAVAVDAVTDILWFPTSKIEPPPPMVAQISGVYVQGVGKDGDRLLIVLDMREILTLEEKKDLGEVAIERPTPLSRPPKPRGAKTAAGRERT